LIHLPVDEDGNYELLISGEYNNVPVNIIGSWGRLSASHSGPYKGRCDCRHIHNLQQHNFLIHTTLVHCEIIIIRNHPPSSICIFSGWIAWTYTYNKSQIANKNIFAHHHFFWNFQHGARVQTPIGHNLTNVYCHKGSLIRWNGTSMLFISNLD
jgi:hypothetical protein